MIDVFGYVIIFKFKQILEELVNYCLIACSKIDKRPINSNWLPYNKCKPLFYEKQADVIFKKYTNIDS